MQNVQQTILSQFDNSPVIVGLIASMNEAIDPSANIDSFYNNIWNIATAQGYGLDLWGRILGVTRILNVSTGDTYFGLTGSTGVSNASGDSLGGGPVTPADAPFYSGAAVTTNFSLTDASYRTLLLAKALFNISNGSIQSINQILINLFLVAVPGRTGNAYCTDGENMTMTYTFSISPVLTPVEYAIVFQSGAIPKPTGVSATVVQI